MPVKFTRKSWTSSTGYYPSEKNGRPINYSSTIERDFFYLLDYYPWILGYEEQPFTIQALLDQKKFHSYTPDCLARHATRGLQIYECKSSKALESADTQKQVRMGAQYATENQAEFHLITELDIRQGFELQDIKLMWRYRNWQVTPSEINFAKNMISTKPNLTINELLAVGKDRPSPLILPQVLAMLYRKHIHVDLSLPLGHESILVLDFVKRSIFPWHA
ncbi:MAG: TnsA endonuclease N-terminal domain-containing protein [Anaerolineales bacterium]|nr:TnsA endonuclease N-terminal domain-containing protein [Anaerolineales bacterium]